MIRTCLVLSLLVCSGVFPVRPCAQERTLPEPALGSIPRVPMPLYVMEYHIWFKAPFGEEAPDGYVHWDIDNERAERAVGPDWVRDKAPVGYPLLGLYNSEDQGVIRWQVQTLRNAGVDGAFVQMYPEWRNGKRFDRLFVWEKVLDIAAQEGLPVAAHDEVHYRAGRPAQKPEVMAGRIGEFVRAYGSHPGYLRIEGQPAIAFQFWDRFGRTMSLTALQATMRRAEDIAGEPIYWIVHAQARDDYFSVPEVDAFVPLPNTVALNREDTEGFGEPRQDWKRYDAHLVEIRRLRREHPQRAVGLWVYPGFNESPRVLKDGRTSIRWMPRRGGRTFVESLEKAVQEDPDFIMLSSWNDWEENTALEPGWLYDGYAGDPYLYARIIALAKGGEFRPAALPPRKSVDPWMWQPLYGIDRLPPAIQAVRYLPMRPGLVATVSDSSSAIQAAFVLHDGDVWIDARDPARIRHTGVSRFTTGKQEGKRAPGLVLDARRSVRIVLDEGALQSSGVAPVYLGIEFLATSGGAIIVRYPNPHKLITYKPGDEQRHPVHARVTLDGDSRHKSAVRLLRGFSVEDDPAELELTLEPPRQGKPSGQVTITRLHLFQAMANAVPGLPIDGASRTSQVRTFLFDAPDLKAKTPTAVYLIAVDSEGNRSAPRPVDGEGFHPLANRP